jgi:uncharacterized protein (TIGR00369 family)
MTIGTVAKWRERVVVRRSGIHRGESNDKGLWWKTLWRRERRPATDDERSGIRAGSRHWHAITAEPTVAHLNPAGTVHGGLSATLLDSCMGLAVHSTLDKGFGQTTLEFKISLVRALTPETGLVRAEGSVIFRGRRISTAEGRLTDTEGRILAHGTTTCLIFEY